MMLVTHRGPFRFSVRRRRNVRVATRGRAVSSSALLPLRRSATDIGERPSWVAAAIDDGDRAAVAAGAATVPGARPASARSSIRRCTACTTTSSPTRCCGSCTTGCSTSPAGPRFDRYLARSVGRVRGGERRVRRRRGRRARPRASRCWCTTTSSRWCPGWCARRGPTCGSRTSPTRRSAVPTRSACCPPTWRRRSARRWAR